MQTPQFCPKIVLDVLEHQDLTIGLQHINFPKKRMLSRCSKSAYQVCQFAVSLNFRKDTCYT